MKRRERTRGVTIVLVCLLILALFVMAALAVDAGLLYTARTAAQSAADAAALAGAFSFLNPVAEQPATAIQDAVATAAKNSILGQSVVIDSSDVIVDLVNRRVTVTVPRTGANGIPVAFARVMGMTHVDVLAKATAEAGQAGAGARCVRPIFIPNTLLSAESVSAACSDGQTIVDPTTHQITPYATGLLGTQTAIRPTSPSGVLVPSQFYSVDFGSGANTYECTLSSCLNDCNVTPASLGCSDSVPVEVGNMVGPTDQGITDLIGNPADVWVGIGEYMDSSGNINDTSRSLSVVPIWDDCTQTITSGTNGQTVTVVGFAEVFIDGVQNNAVQAHLVNVIGCDASGTPGSATGPYALPVRLVQTP